MANTTSKGGFYMDNETNKLLEAANYLKSYCEKKSDDLACSGCPFVIKRPDRKFLLCAIGDPATSFHLSQDGK